MLGKNLLLPLLAASALLTAARTADAQVAFGVTIGGPVVRYYPPPVAYAPPAPVVGAYYYAPSPVYVAPTPVVAYYPPAPVYYPARVNYGLFGRLNVRTPYYHYRW